MNKGDKARPVAGCLPEVGTMGNLFTVHHVADGYIHIERRSSERMAGVNSLIIGSVGT